MKLPSNRLAARRSPPAARPPAYAAQITAHGKVREWHAEDGWGVIESDATPDGCWAHCSAIQMTGYRSLERGEIVTFTYEFADQDGYSFRALQIGRQGSRPPHPSDDDRRPGGHAGYRSSLRLDVDDQ